MRILGTGSKRPSLNTYPLNKNPATGPLFAARTAGKDKEGSDGARTMTDAGGSASQVNHEGGSQVVGFVCECGQSETRKEKWERHIRRT